MAKAADSGLKTIATFNETSFFERHSHSDGQFIVAIEGSIWAQAGNKSWYLHPRCGLWIPPHLPHSASHLKGSQVLSFYLDQESCQGPLEEVFSVRITPLLRELLNHIRQFKKEDVQGNKELLQFLVYQMQALRTQNICLPNPEEKRLLKCLNYVLKNLDEDPSIVEASRASGASPKTLERLFSQDLQTTFRSWKSSVKMVVAASRIQQGRSITDVALSVGYQSTSAFIHCFKKYYQVSPRRYLTQEQT